MRSLKVKKTLPAHVFVIIIDCDGCGIECNVEPIYEFENPETMLVRNYCITCLHRNYPEVVEVVE